MVPTKVINVIRCPIWYHLYNLKNVKNTHGEVLLNTWITSQLDINARQTKGSWPNFAFNIERI